MKKLLLLAFVIGVGFTACKKEETAQPKETIKKESLTPPAQEDSSLDYRKDTAGWD